MSTSPAIPGTEPVLDVCQNVHPCPPQLAAGTRGASVFQCAIHRTG